MKEIIVFVILAILFLLAIVLSAFQTTRNGRLKSPSDPEKMILGGGNKKVKFDNVVQRRDILHMGTPKEVIVDTVKKL